MTLLLGTEKKIMQPLGTKNHSTSRNQKNHATSQDKKNHATSWNKQKITQPFGTQKCPKNPNLSHNQNPGDRHRSPWSCFIRITNFVSLQ